MTINAELSKFIKDPKIAYFSMEIGILNDVKTYSGGLGVLAGDTIRSGADLKLPMVAVSLIYKRGYFEQELDPHGQQIEHPAPWNPEKFMTLLNPRTRILLDGRDVHVKAWLYIQKSIGLAGGEIPILFLDTDLPENAPEDRELTMNLYGGDDRYRLKQEALLGIAGVRMLRQLDFEIRKYHMNEGHASLLTIELLHEYKRDIEEVWDEDLVWDITRVREMCVFTTHTPVAAGHDKFSYELAREVLGEILPFHILQKLAGEAMLNMTILGLNLSEHVNGVAKKHRDVSKNMFPGYEITAITNGVHSYTWTCESMRRLYDKHIPGWANEPELFVRIGRIPDEALWEAHMEAKRKFLSGLNERYGCKLDPELLTIGFARRATAYKRASLLFKDIERLASIAGGKVQFLFAGKAHPKDDPGKEGIRQIFECAERLRGRVRALYLAGYDMRMALDLVSGVDVWLNTPMRPREASGTSGMKAAHNGVLNFSVLDGWWIEGHIEGYTGWSIGAPPVEDTLVEPSDDQDVEDLYQKLERVIIPTYYDDRHTWIRMMQNSIGKNAYYFNSHRMMRRYVTEAYIN